MQVKHPGVLVFVSLIVSVALLTASGRSRLSAHPVDAMHSIRVDGGLLAAAPADAAGVRAFKGIPYAAPPVGQRRWQAPAPVEAWTGVSTVEKFGAPCMQTPLAGYDNSLAASDSEDCLSLNLWTAAKSRGEKLPVLVWFHGGAFVIGSGAASEINGASLAARGLIVVTVNYRIGPFGFLAHPELTTEAPQHTSGNYALLDQVAALGWVQRNIAAFGGDPKRVTISGSSAGGTSVNVLMVSPLAKGKFSRVIANSGAALPTTGVDDSSPLPRSIEENKGLHFARSVGARNLAELRALPAETLAAAAGGQWGAWAWNASIDGYVLPAAPGDIFARGRQSDVPLMIGWTGNEGATMGLATFGDDRESFRDQIVARFGQASEEVFRLYPVGSLDAERASKVALAGDGFIGFPSWRWITAQQRTGKQPIFVYQFNHAPPVPPDYGKGTMLGAPGAFHGAQTRYFFGTLPSGWKLTEADRNLSATLQSYWINFARTGNPNGGGLSVWTAYDGTAPQKLYIDATGARSAPDAELERFVALERLFRESPAAMRFRGMDTARWKDAPH